MGYNQEYNLSIIETQTPYKNLIRSHFYPYRSHKYEVKEMSVLNAYSVSTFTQSVILKRTRIWK